MFLMNLQCMAQEPNQIQAEAKNVIIRNLNIVNYVHVPYLDTLYTLGTGEVRIIY